MKKKWNFNVPWQLSPGIKRTIMRMKLICMILLVSLFQSIAGVSYSQTATLSLKLTNSSVKNVLLAIEEQTEYYFLYSSKMIDTNRKVSVNLEKARINDILDAVFKGTGVTYTVEGRQIVLSSDDQVINYASAQQRKVTGIVTDHSGHPLPGVTVVVRGTTTGTVSAADGSYTLAVPAGEQILVFSFVGMKTIELQIAGRNTVNVKMEEETIGIEEVVAIAYGTARKKDLTGSISTVDAQTIALQSNSTVTRALEGAVPGLQVSAVDGQPGLDMGIRLRGMGSSTQSYSNALIVIDGVPSQHDNPLSTINPKDIAGVTILKDAASTALYGSRGANGVVLITTKRGGKQDTKISFEGRWGINQVGPYQFDKMSDPKDIYEYAWLTIYNSVRYGDSSTGVAKNYTTNVQNPNMSHEAAAEFASQHLFNYIGKTNSFSRNALGNWMLYDVPGAVYTPDGTSATSSATMTGAYLVNTDGKLNPNARLLYDDNYDKYLLENNFRQEYNLSASGGNEKVDYFFSLGYLEDPSYIRGSDFARYNGRSNINAQLYNWLKVGTNISYSWRETQSPATRYGRNPGSAQANIFRYINGQNQLIQLYAHDEDGNYIYENGKKKVHVLAGDTYSPLGLTSTSYGSTDPLIMLDEDLDIRKSSDIVTRSYADIQLTKDLVFTTNLGFEKYHETRTRYWQSETGQAVSSGGAFGKVYQNVTILNTQQLLNYNKEIEKHHLQVLLGHEFNKYQLENLNYNSAYELVPGYVAFVNFVGRYTGGTFSSPGGSETETAMESYLGRLNYTYNDKYYAEASLRRDGSSKFKHNKDRWGNFWSVGAGWRISAEDFMGNTRNWLDNLKVRASYGLIGNQSGIGNYASYQTWSYGATYTSTTAGTGIPASYTLTKGGYTVENLTWEKTKTFDFGIDFGLFQRVHGTLDFYNKLTFDAFFNKPIAYSLGQSTILTNEAELRNRGFEVELNIDLIKQKDLYWGISLNGTTYSMVLTKVPDNVVSESLGGYTADADAWNISGAGTSSNGVYLRNEGKPYYNLYLYRYGGVDQNTGLPLFYHKVTGDDHASGLFTDTEVGENVKTTNYTMASRYEMGSAIPDWIGGFNTTVRYKNFDFTAMFAYQLGGKFYSTEYGNGLYRGDDLSRALSAELIGNTWTPENTGAKFPMAMYGNTYGDGATFGSWMYTDLALFSASYLNFKNITLGYTVPKDKLQRYRINSLRLYVSADNLYMLTEHSGIDPRMSLIGGFEVGAYSYPPMRTISFGVNLDL
jgi:TonB-linked SusC/RagA family outer membrane protein